jgi:hypothetical protein
MRINVATIFLILCAGCAGTSAPQAEPSLGEKLSSNLVQAHEIYCSGSPEAKDRLSKLKAANPPYQVVNRKTSEASKVWVVQAPVSDASNVTWGLSLSEPVIGGGCGVAYLKPEELEILKTGYQP